MRPEGFGQGVGRGACDGDRERVGESGEGHTEMAQGDWGGRIGGEGRDGREARTETGCEESFSGGGEEECARRLRGERLFLCELQPSGGAWRNEAGGIASGGLEFVQARLQIGDSNDMREDERGILGVGFPLCFFRHCEVIMAFPERERQSHREQIRENGVELRGREERDFQRNEQRGIGVKGGGDIGGAVFEGLPLFGRKRRKGLRGFPLPHHCQGRLKGKGIIKAETKMRHRSVLIK